MSRIGRDFRQWVLAQRVEGVAPDALDDDRIRFTLERATAEVNFYPFEESEVCELRVTRATDGDTTFFLHFELTDTGIEHARELFGQLVEALAAEESQDVTRILLTCTSAFTTTMFATKMGEVADTLKLGYRFEALALEQALATTESYAAIMLAPQAAYMRKAMADAHPEALVFEIPGKVFGSFDAPTAVGLLMHALRELDTPTDRRVELKAVRDLSDRRRILAITVFGMQHGSRVGWRLYDQGKGIAEGAFRRERLDFADVGDLITMLSVGEIDLTSLDAIAVAVPGVTFRGIVDLPDYGMPFYDIGRSLTERFRVPVYVDNNCNAAAVGCYVSQDEVENLVFYRHAFGHPAGGMGTVIDGRILKGRFNLAGEPRYFGHYFDYGQSVDEARWTAEGLHLMAKYVSLCAISIVSPDALYLSVDTVDDAQEFKADLARDLGETYVPEIHLVGDYVERVYLGTLAMALQKLRDTTYRSHGVGSIPEAFAHAARHE